MIEAQILENHKIMISKNAVSDSVKYETIRFRFPKAWDTYVKTATFKTEDSTVSVVLQEGNPLCVSENECYIPHEVLTFPGFNLSVFGNEGDTLATTANGFVTVIKSGYEEGVSPKEPTPDEYSQIITLMTETKDIAQSVRDDADNGLFKGEKGEKGDSGNVLADQKYNPKSENAQSGKAVAEAIAEALIGDDYSFSEIKGLNVTRVLRGENGTYTLTLDFISGLEGEIILIFGDQVIIGVSDNTEYLNSIGIEEGSTYQIKISNGAVEYIGKMIYGEADNSGIHVGTEAPQNENVHVWLDTDDESTPFSVNVSEIDGGHRVSITDNTGTNSFEILNGKAGAPGYSPIKEIDYWTSADQESIVQDVITALGTPILGRVNDKNEIILTGVTENGNYTLKYENSDGTQTTIGALIFEPVVNLADPNGSEWIVGQRLNSSEALVDCTGCNISNYIPCKEGDVIRVKGLNISHYDNGNTRSYVRYYADKNSTSIAAEVPADNTDYYVCSGDVWTFTIRSDLANASNINYVRVYGDLMSGYTKDDVVITVNQVIQ